MNFNIWTAQISDAFKKKIVYMYVPLFFFKFKFHIIIDVILIFFIFILKADQRDE
jgi:hypothetical protein